MSRQPLRDSAGLHRSAIVAVDKLSVPATPTSVTESGTSGTLVFNTAYNITVAANTLYGPTTVPAVGTVTMANDAVSTHTLRATIAQVTGALSYDIFMSTAAAPLWVARITEAERAAGVTITAVGTVSATSPGAGKVDVRVVGTGLASNVAPFALNQAIVTSGITPIDATGYSTAIAHVYLSVTDLRSLPTAGIAWLTSPLGSAGAYVQSLGNTFTVLSGARTPLRQSFAFTLAPSAGQLIVLVDTLTGQGASVDIWVDLL